MADPLEFEPIALNDGDWLTRSEVLRQKTVEAVNEHEGRITELEDNPELPAGGTSGDVLQRGLDGTPEWGPGTPGPPGGVNRVADLQGDITAEGLVDAIDGPLSAKIADAVAYTINYGTNLSTLRQDASGNPIVGRVIWQGVGGYPVNRLPDDVVLVQAVRDDPAWTPASLPGLHAWFDAQSLAVADGTLLAAWPDRSPNGFNAAAGAAGTLPAYNAAGVMGLPSVRFDGSNDYMQLTFPEHAGLPWTVYCVAMSLPVATTGDDAFFGGGSTLVSGARVVLERRSAGALRGVSATTSLASADGITNNAAHLYKLVQAGSSSLVAIDGATVAAGTLPTSSVGTNVLRLGGRADGTNFLDGHLCEVIFVKGTVTPANDALVTAYLNSRWWLA